MVLGPYQPGLVLAGDFGHELAGMQAVFEGLLQVLNQAVIAFRPDELLVFGFEAAPVCFSSMERSAPAMKAALPDVTTMISAKVYSPDA